MWDGIERGVFRCFQQEDRIAIFTTGTVKSNLLAGFYMTMNCPSGFLTLPDVRL
jgi:hypothetical protein